MPDFTVAIRTHNGALRLPAVLAALRSQTGLDQIPWEIVIVDNCSVDNTATVIHSYQAHWSAASSLRYCYEPRLGASHARRRAIDEAQAPLIGFLDDDNVPAQDWVKAAITFAAAHPEAAAVGSQIHGVYEVSPPRNFDRIAQFLPIIERDEIVCFTQGIYAFTNTLPPGAGLVIRRAVWLNHVPQRQILKGPVGRSLSQKGEDIEALLYIKKAGGTIWFNPAMHIYHQIPKTRLERDYLLRFFRGIGISRYHTRMIRYPHWQRPLILPAYILNDFRKLILHLLKYKNTARNDVVVASERELLMSSLLSPLQTWVTWLKAQIYCLRNPRRCN
ncbi:EAL domain-containing protein/glycosyl transferase [Halomicronema hongdechloris C2206]|uniref:EAL domain-containing protein/glycosyl transferase n=1 Tax=Halomicronema hongdechloris C2206 TaxID=1641165 RepID=A0A1Z3HP38_9CYAN|nr:hormogonium polysaccharide biosynthesis glycosyltransferase HpsE [Halomicronema hongdechloris]ASC72058.1 EAL domain-containing protein/glycosyl transferase [Halomicronema hongdechloris C2206]